MVMLALPFLCSAQERGQAEPSYPFHGLRLWSFSTDVTSWAMLGTINFEAERAVSQKTSIYVGAKFNPWTFRYGQEDEFRARVIRPYIGVRWWPFHYYSGWFVGIEALGSIHNYANIFNSNCYEGWFAGLGLNAGYSFMLSERVNLSIGAGGAVGWFSHKIFTAPRCGRLTDGDKSGITIQPSALYCQFSWLF